MDSRMRINCVSGCVAVTEAIAIGRAGVCRSVLDPGIGPVPGNVPNCPLLIVKSSGASNWAASTEVSNRGYKCVLASPSASRCLPTSNPYCLRSRLLDLANWSASSSVSTPPPLPCALAQGNRHSVATSTQAIFNSHTSIAAPIDPLSLIAVVRSAKLKTKCERSQYQTVSTGCSWFMSFYIGRLASLRCATIELAVGLQPIIKL